jgi:hypothetical protein
MKTLPARGPGKTMWFGLGAALFSCLLVLSCDFPQAVGHGNDEKGRLSIVLPGGNHGARAVLPDQFTTTLRYQITLTGPGGEIIERETVGGTLTVLLEPGDWTVTVKSYDGNNYVGTGSGTARVVPGEPVSVLIKMSVDPGYEANLTDIYIHNEAELRRIGTDFAIDGTKNFHLENDITLTEPWTPIGPSAGSPFMAVFDGHEHTVTVTAFSPDALAAEYMGFFGAAEDAEIKNLRVAYNLGGTVHNTSTEMFVYAGGITGYAQTTSIRNVKVSGSLRVSNSNIHFPPSPSFSTSLKIGGIAGAYFDGIIENSHVIQARGDTLEGSAADVYAGGIVGELSSTYSSPVIKASSFTGTAAAQSAGGNGVACGGGIAGQIYKGTITACYAAGTIQVTASPAGNFPPAYAGGIAGYSAGTGITITNCYTVTAVDADSPAANSSPGSSYAGGIAGYANSIGEISKSYAAGAVKGQGATGVRAGGLVGEFGAGGTIEYCRNFLTTLDGDASGDVHTLFAGGSVPPVIHNDNSFWNAVAITRGGTTYTNNDSFASLNWHSTYDGVTSPPTLFPPAYYADPSSVSDSYPTWNFSADWAWISGYALPVLSWQTSPPDLGHIPGSLGILP